MARRWVVGILVAIAGIGVIASVSAGERRGPPWMHGGWHGGHHRWAALSPEDRAAFADARIAAVHAGLKLTPDQEKLWPPVEAAMRDLAKLREARIAGREARAEEDPPTRLRRLADGMTARGEAVRKLADATDPLYATFDDGQKRRARMLARPFRGGPGPGGWRRHGGDDKPGRDD